MRGIVRNPVFTALAAVALALPSVAAAQGVPVIVVRVRGEPTTDEAALVQQVLATTPGAYTGAPLRTQINARYASLPIEGDPLAPLRERLAQARAAWRRAQRDGDEGAAQRAIQAIENAVAEMERSPDARDTSQANFAEIQRCLILAAEHYVASGNERAALEAMDRLARLEPTAVLPPRAASPEVQQLYTTAVGRLQTGGANVNAAGAEACEVYRDGLLAGNAPVLLQNLAPGEHRIALRCGALRSRIHRFVVTAGAVSTQSIDVGLDDALLAEDTVALQYNSADEASARRLGHLLILGRALGTRRLIAVIPRERRALVIDVTMGRELPSAPNESTSNLPLGPIRTEAPASEPEPRPVRVAPPTPRNTGIDSIRRGSGIPAGAFILGVSGVALVGAGVYLHLFADNVLNEALQTPPGQGAAREERERTSETLRWVEVGCFLGGGLLTLGGVIHGIVGSQRAPAPARASIAPIRGGAMLTIGGVL